jgi:quinol monooxygenase YgiN
MIKRIVKMSFHMNEVAQFKKVYEENWTRIRSFEGCRHVELLQAKNTPNIFFTFSIWESEEHLENYRNSELFKSVWSRTRILFNDKASAWSLDEVSF